jgi:hypothetical protein|tara:strand:- start:2032 stop:2229 length:198 start_codon:yes stop_codon:yes gene_type:complete
MAAPRRTPGDGHRSPYGMDGEVSGGQLLKNLVTPIRWGIGGITKTVRDSFRATVAPIGRSLHARF